MQNKALPPQVHRPVDKF